MRGQGVHDARKGWKRGRVSWGMEFQEIQSEGWYRKEEQVYVRFGGGGGGWSQGRGAAAGSQAAGCDVICCGLEPSGGTWASSTGSQRPWASSQVSSRPQLSDLLSFPPLGHLEKRHRFLRE